MRVWFQTGAVGVLHRTSMHELQRFQRFPGFPLRGPKDVGGGEAETGAAEEPSGENTMRVWR
jgi:hypothetical protein